MKYILNSKQMKQVDNISIHKFGIPSMVLMERAALGIADLVENKYPDNMKVICICGNGNNGADGIAAARILYEREYNVTILVVGTESEECKLQLSIAKKSGVKIKKYTRNKVKLNEYNLIIDALFGIGLSRNIEGSYLELISEMNGSKAKVVSVDIPSGIHASTGQIMGNAVKADYTVTFGYKKTGLVLYPGSTYAGKVKTIDIGFPKVIVEKIPNKVFTFTKEDLCILPKKTKNSNKGMFGKVLVIAGSELMGGAAYLAGLSAYRSGTGLVKILTHANNRNLILKSVPEVLLTTYESDIREDQLKTVLEHELEWATSIIIGPGLSKSNIAGFMTKYVIKNTKVPTIIDADALNIISEIIYNSETETVLDGEEKQIFSREESAVFIFTPHIGEMERLSGIQKDVIKADPFKTVDGFMENFMKQYRNNLNMILVLKDARTIVADGYGNRYINCSGNSGMAKGGSGDVLTGVIAGLISNQMSCFEASCMGAYIHGLAGDESAAKKGEYGMKAGDIIDNICSVMK